MRHYDCIADNPKEAGHDQTLHNDHRADRRLDGYGFHRPGPAIEVAPRISNREIIERLSELKQGNRDLNERMGDINQSVNKRIDNTNKRIDDLTQSMNIRFSDLQQNMNQRFAVNDQRIMAQDDPKLVETMRSQALL